MPHVPTSDPGYCFLMHAGLQIFYRPDGRFHVQPCPKWNHSTQFECSDYHSDFFQHPNLVAVREANISSRSLPDACKLCRDYDACGGNDQSRNTRNAMNHYYHHRYTDLSEPRYGFRGPVHLIIRADLSCNLACVTCGPNLSTRWRIEENIKGWAVRPDLNDLRQILARLDLSELRELHIFGGETVLGPTTPAILRALQAQLPQITVWFDSNATIRPSKELQDLLTQCKSVMYKCSIDAWGPAFEYLRWPGSWSETQDNLLWLNETLADNAQLCLRPAIGTLNGECIWQLEQWHRQYFSQRPNGADIRIEYNGVYKLYSFAHAPDAMIDNLHQIYPKDHAIFNLIPPQRSDKIKEVRSALDLLDRQRGTDYTQSLPHLCQY